MQFSQFLGIKEMKDLIVKKYNQDLQDIRNWWNDHDSGVRQWTVINAKSVTATGYLGPIFVDRGDPSSADFTSFTNDAVYHVLSLGSIVPTGAVAVAIAYSVTSTAAGGGDVFQMRKNGNAHNINQTFITTQVANLAMQGDAIVACDTSQNIQYIMNFAGSPTIFLVIKGWWM